MPVLEGRRPVIRLVREGLQRGDWQCALVNAVLAQPRAGESDFLGTGFRDTTRLASGEAGMWRDIALDNAEAIAAAVEDLQNELSQLRSALNAKDAAALENFFAQAQSHRADWLKKTN